VFWEIEFKAAKASIIIFGKIQQLTRINVKKFRRAAVKYVCYLLQEIWKNCADKK
jgi:hypothetical protein